MQDSIGKRPVEHESYCEDISISASLIAHLRTFTDIPFAKEISQSIGSEIVFRSIIGNDAEIHKSMIAFTPSFEARYKAINRIIQRSEIRQVLEVAAGLSPRCLENTKNHDMVYVATDLPRIIEQLEPIIKKILTKTGITRPNLYFKPVNVLDRNSLLETTRFFKSHEHTAVINDGLLMYFNLEEKNIAASNILELLKKSGGIWITSDAGTNESMQNVFSENKDLKKIASRVSSVTGRNMKKNNFKNDKNVREFFEDAGFTIEEFPHSNVIDDLSSVKILNLEKNMVGSMLQGRNTLILTPRV